MRTLFLILLMVFTNINNIISGSSSNTDFSTSIVAEKKEEVKTITFTLELEAVEVFADVQPVQHLLDRVPLEQQAEFVNILREFATERNFDWRMCLLIMYQESSLDTKMEGIHLPSYVGIAMFGRDVRKQFGLTRSQVLNMNHVEQVKLAVRMWEMNEKNNGVTINSFLKLHLANFYPVWLKYADRNGILPAPDHVKAANSTLLSSNGEFTCQGLMGFFRRKVQRNQELKWFRNKI